MFDTFFFIFARVPVYMLGADDALPETPSQAMLNPDAFVVYQGHHGDRGALLADLVHKPFIPTFMAFISNTGNSTKIFKLALFAQIVYLYLLFLFYIFC